MLDIVEPIYGVNVVQKVSIHSTVLEIEQSINSPIPWRIFDFNNSRTFAKNLHETLIAYHLTLLRRLHNSTQISCRGLLHAA